MKRNEELIGPPFWNRLRFYRLCLISKGTPVEILSSLPNGTKVRFNENWEMESAVLASDARIKGHFLPKGTTIRFENGVISSAVLGDKATLQGRSFPRGTEIRFFEDGAISSAKLGDHENIDGIVFPEGTTIHFLRGGNIYKAVLDRNAEMYGKWFPEGTTFRYRNGAIESFDSGGPFNEMFDDQGRIRSLPKAFFGNLFENMTARQNIVPKPLPPDSPGKKMIKTR